MFPDQQEMQQAVYQALRAALGLTETEGSRHLARAYQDSPPMNPGPGMNVCYYQLVTEAQGKETMEMSVYDHVPCVYQFVPAQLVVVFYGPACERWAHRCQEFLFLDGNGMPRQILRETGIFPVPAMLTPSVLYEENGKTWRKRADLVVPVRIRVHEEYGSVISGETTEVGTITEAPEIIM